MKKIVRKGVFETNSSSTHSISMSSEDKEFVLDTIYPDQFGKIYVNGGEFGWEWEKHNDAQTKLDYAYESGISKELLENVVKDQTGATEVVFGNPDGYVDHQSYGTAQGVCVDEEPTRNFIFNKNSWLFIGNDNSDANPTFYHVPIYKDGRITTPVYKYELSIEGLNESTYYLEYPNKEELDSGVESLMSDVYMSETGYIFKESGINFQITKSPTLFEKSWNVQQDYSKGFVIMLREHSYYDMEKKLNEKDLLKDMNWTEKSKVITRELLKEGENAKKLSITITKI